MERNPRHPGHDRNLPKISDELLALIPRVEERLEHWFNTCHTEGDRHLARAKEFLGKPVPRVQNGGVGQFNLQPQQQFGQQRFGHQQFGQPPLQPQQQFGQQHFEQPPLQLQQQSGQPRMASFGESSAFQNQGMQAPQSLKRPSDEFSRELHPTKRRELSPRRPACEVYCQACGRLGHSLKNCAESVSPSGFLWGCPRCNRVTHLYEFCTEKRNPCDDAYFLLQCRHNLAPLAYSKALQDLPKFDASKYRPWSPAFALKQNMYNLQGTNNIVDPAWANGTITPDTFVFAELAYLKQEMIEMSKLIDEFERASRHLTRMEPPEVVIEYPMTDLDSRDLLIREYAEETGLILQIPRGVSNVPLKPSDFPDIYALNGKERDLADERNSLYKDFTCNDRIIYNPREDQMPPATQLLPSPDPPIYENEYIEMVATNAWSTDVGRGQTNRGQGARGGGSRGRRGTLGGGDSSGGQNTRGGNSRGRTTRGGSDSRGGRNTRGGTRGRNTNNLPSFDPRNPFGVLAAESEAQADSSTRAPTHNTVSTGSGLSTSRWNTSRQNQTPTTDNNRFSGSPTEPRVLLASNDTFDSIFNDPRWSPSPAASSNPAPRGTGLNSSRWNLTPASQTSTTNTQSHTAVPNANTRLPSAVADSMTLSSPIPTQRTAASNTNIRLPSAVANSMALSSQELDAPRANIRLPFTVADSMAPSSQVSNTPRTDIRLPSIVADSMAPSSQVLDAPASNQRLDNIVEEEEGEEDSAVAPTRETQPRYVAPRGHMTGSQAKPATPYRGDNGQQRGLIIDSYSAFRTCGFTYKFLYGCENCGATHMIARCPNRCWKCQSANHKLPDCQYNC